MTWLLVYVRCMMYVHGMFKDHDLKNCARIRLYDRILHTTTIYEKKNRETTCCYFCSFRRTIFFPSRYDLRLLIPETRDKMLLVIKMCDYYCKNVYGIIYFQMCWFLKLTKLRLHNQSHQITEIFRKIENQSILQRFWCLILLQLRKY